RAKRDWSADVCSSDLKEEEINCNEGAVTSNVTVINTGDRPIQIGSHYHFYEVNEALKFHFFFITRLKSNCCPRRNIQSFAIGLLDRKRVVEGTHVDAR